MHGGREYPIAIAKWGVKVPQGVVSTICIINSSLCRSWLARYVMEEKECVVKYFLDEEVDAC